MYFCVFDLNISNLVFFFYFLGRNDLNVFLRDKYKLIGKFLFYLL